MSGQALREVDTFHYKGITKENRPLLYPKYWNSSFSTSRLDFFSNILSISPKTNTQAIQSLSKVIIDPL